MTAAHLFVDDLDVPEIAARDRHHVARVLRVRPGEEVTISDGAGGLRRCVVESGLALAPSGPVSRDPAPTPTITVGFALVKHERPEWIVQKLTECGVDRVIPFQAARSIVKWDPEKAERHVERWREIAREAAMQSRRAWLPDVSTVQSFVAASSGDAVLADVDGATPSLDATTVLVGPEGGWAEEELGAVAGRMALGSHTFRVETAAVAAGVLLTALRSGLVRPAGHSA